MAWMRRRRVQLREWSCVPVVEYTTTTVIYYNLSLVPRLDVNKKMEFEAEAMSVGHSLSAQPYNEKLIKCPTSSLLFV